jgi:hypothetical protein
VACNVASADMIITSPLLAADYQPLRPDFAARSVETFRDAPLERICVIVPVDVQVTAIGGTSAPSTFTYTDAP